MATKKKFDYDEEDDPYFIQQSKIPNIPQGEIKDNKSNERDSSSSTVATKSTHNSTDSINLHQEPSRPTALSHYSDTSTSQQPKGKFEPMNILERNDKKGMQKHLGNYDGEEDRIGQESCKNKCITF